MPIKLSGKTAMVSYKKFNIAISDVKLHDGRWYCTATITSPLDAPYVDIRPLYLDFDCETDDEAIERAKQYAADWIENNSAQK